MFGYVVVQHGVNNDLTPYQVLVERSKLRTRFCGAIYHACRRAIVLHALVHEVKKVFRQGRNKYDSKMDQEHALGRRFVCTHQMAALFLAGTLKLCGQIENYRLRQSVRI